MIAELKTTTTTMIPIALRHRFHNNTAHSGLYQSTIPQAHNLSRTSNNRNAVFDTSPVVARGKVFVNCDREPESPGALAVNTGDVPKRHTDPAPGTAEVVTISKAI
ncbi:hypothetical protein KDK67_09290, partial [Methanococcoides seepicolus]|nr:hypothetical protein [Methanococcoides seepicolus]